VKKFTKTKMEVSTSTVNCFINYLFAALKT
jgi:hypothetical protein